jgi:hypothetical protein
MFHKYQVYIRIITNKVCNINPLYLLLAGFLLLVFLLSVTPRIQWDKRSLNIFPAGYLGYDLVAHTDDNKKGELELSGLLYKPALSFGSMMLFSGDCITSIKIGDNYVGAGNCFGKDTHMLSLNSLKPGKHEIRINLSNEGDDIYVVQRYDYYDFFVQLLHALIGIIIVLILKKVTDSYFATIGAIYIITRYWYLAYTPFTDRTQDLWDGFKGHINYIFYIANTRALPNVDGWEYHQQPFYYVIQAMVLGFLKLLHIAQEITILQWINVVIGFIFIYIVYCALLFIIRSKARSAVLTLFITLLPAFIIHSLRISNDTLFMVFTAYIVFVLILRSKNISSYSYIYELLILTTLAFFTKFTSIIMAPILVYIWWYCRDRATKYVYVPIVFFVLALLSMSILTLEYYNKVDNFPKSQNYINMNIFLPPSSMNGQLAIDNSFQNLFVFDTKLFIEKNWISPWSGTERDYFLNYFLKTLFWGEFRFFQDKSIYLGYILHLLGSLMLIFIVIGSLLIRKNTLMKYKEIAMVVGISLLSLVFYRINTGYAPNQDMRFIFGFFCIPLMLTYSYLQVLFYKYNLRSTVVYFLYIYTPYLFVCISIAMQYSIYVQMHSR